MSHLRYIVVQDTENHPISSSKSMCRVNMHDNERTGRHATISQESLEAIVGVGDRVSDGDFSNSKGWYPFSFYAGERHESTPGLTDCSSRSSLQDLDLSIDDGFDYFRDPQPSPDVRYQCADGPDTPGSCLASSLSRSSSRSVSFSGIETIFGADDEVKSTKESKSGLIYPKTPTVDWYASKRSSHITRQEPPHKLAIAPLASSPRRKLQRSAMKKQDRGVSSTSHPDVSLIHIPSSPKITWYSSKR